MPNWEEFFPSITRPKPDAALAVVGRGPSIRLTPAAVAAMDNPTHVVLGFDRVGQRVSIQASNPEIRHAFPLKRYGDGNMSNVSAGGFTKWAGIDHDKRIEYPIEKVDGSTIAFRLNNDSRQPGEFEEYRYKNVALADLIPNVSVGRNGHIGFNRPAMELIDFAPQVVLVCDPVEKLIGFKPSPNAPNARPIRPLSGQRTWSLAGEGFLKQFGIQQDTGRSYEPRLEDGVLIVDLNRPKPARNQGKKSTTAVPVGAHR
jgi:hypothetical protein